MTLEPAYEYVKGQGWVVQADSTTLAPNDGLWNVIYITHEGRWRTHDHRDEPMNYQRALKHFREYTDGSFGPGYEFKLIQWTEDCKSLYADEHPGEFPI